MGMKAYYVSDRNCDSGYGYVVFAETRGKAIAHALSGCDCAFDDYTWTEMRATRRPVLDKFYDGRTEMDWCNMDDRTAMVKYAGFSCSYEVDATVEECIECLAHEWCDRYESMIT